jgi:hypothetical protein
VLATAKQGGEVWGRWSWVEPAAWTERMLTALEKGVKGGGECVLFGAWAVQSGKSPCEGLSTHLRVNHQLESRMREIRQSGSEGGGPNPIGPSYPYKAYPGKLFQITLPTLKGAGTGRRDVPRPFVRVGNKVQS